MKQFWIIPILLIFTSCSNSHEKKASGQDDVFKTIYFVRHAEKDLTDTTNNPPLTPEGKMRAEKLKNILKDQPVDAIYSTKYQRNINTVRPLADLKEIDIQMYAWTKWQPMIDKIKKNDEKFIVICGHGDNILPMINALGVNPPKEKLMKHEYDKLFVVYYGDSTYIKMKSY